MLTLDTFREYALMSEEEVAALQPGPEESRTGDYFELASVAVIRAMKVSTSLGPVYTL